MTPASLPFTMRPADAARRALGQMIAPAGVAELRGWTAEQMAQRIASGTVMSVHLADGKILIPTMQFERGKARPGPVFLAVRAAFADVEPTGILAVSWLLQAQAPFGFYWRDLNAMCNADNAVEVVTMLAERDATRVAAIAAGTA